MRHPTNLTHAQLFLDDAILEQQTRLQRVVHQPTKFHGNPVYTVETPWEGTGMVYLGGVHIDPKDSLWKAWYVTLNPPEYPEIVYAVCMIVSDDGFHWRRPDLEVFRGHNGERTNIVLDLGPAGRTAAPSVIHEPENEAEPWTMFLSLAWPAESTLYKGYLLKSADGIHWRWLNERPEGIVHGFHDRTTAFRGPDADLPYVMIGRGKEDMHRWSLPRVAHWQATDGRTVSPEEPVRVVVPDLEDDPAMQVYHAYAFPYEGIYVGMFQHYVEADDPYGEMELIFSRDAKLWHRLRPRQVFLPRSQEGEFDSHVTDTALSPPVRTYAGRQEFGGTDTLWFCYWGGQAMHGNRHITWGRGMGLAQLRGDGFCSLRARRFPGMLVTKPLVWPGGRLLVNAACLGGTGSGSFRTEVLSEDLSLLPGLSREETDPLGNDGTRQVQTWRGDPLALDSLAGRTIRFRFLLDDYDLYSFRALPNRETHPG